MSDINNKHNPTRMCVACRKVGDKSEFLRVTKTKDGFVSLDITGKNEGRGAYVCKTEACQQKAIKQKQFNRAFKCDVPNSVYNELGMKDL